MATLTNVYDVANLLFMKAKIDPLAVTLKVALLSDAYVFSSATSSFSGEIEDEITGTGYTAGGKTLTSKTIAPTGGVAFLDAADVIWTGLSGTFLYAVIYAPGTYDGVADPVLICITLDDTLTPITVTATDYQITWNAYGIMGMWQYA